MTQHAESTDPLLAPTHLLNHDAPSMQRLVERRRWMQLEEMERIGAVYDFVRNEIRFGYNADDDIPADRVLVDGYGQCNTKATLLMALLRAVNVRCRFHAATIHKSLQQGVVPGLAYRFAPEQILHSWVEVRIGEEWIRLEGVILDDAYLRGLRAYLSHDRGPLLGYAVGTDDLADPPIAWTGCDTEIQMTGVDGDLGTHDAPDGVYAAAGTNLGGAKAAAYRLGVRHLMNRRVAAIRSRGATGGSSHADAAAEATP